MDRAYSTYGREQECVKGFAFNFRRKEAIGKTYTRREDNIKVNFREIVWGDMDLIHLVQDRGQSCEHGNGFCKVLGIFSLTERFSASQQVP
jgi:hypothetical protein